ncbi:nicotinate-nucleotide pyrophosphorylase [carboxylating] [Sporobacter termitidis DSM 10068]|uniref:Probable nicotinate-nucleotide pyrophosphorylase [carboxylating] n=1 Tax=Sporobacter termitidis DSM 10068 TaxID=1123282 RepID=A0A1M5TAR2_9FIRM|nr:carboxylating nicotinate-nucleotide diphosphorylase [Sporobacter termitidis]SHH47875.1 nicotinate-nucleotide pyrophosphorylase [carboxylating] [Sporobacter termitidis DSM 10068]
MSEQFDYIGLNRLITTALAEDIGTGDITTISCVAEDAVSSGRFIAKADGVVCGAGILARLFYILDHRVHVKVLLGDGAHVNKGDVIAEIEGPARSILTGERTALNILQHLSGIATRTDEAVRSIEGYDTKIADTRKTLPGLRVLEKYAVRCGGGRNHRFNLSDGVLIKDNHIVAAGGIREAVAAVRKNAPHTLKIEVETESIAQIDEALESGADIIMLDNMTVDQMAEAVRHIAGRAITEASGNMGDRDLKQVAATGVDYISIGALTHSVKALDISLQFK